MTVPSWVLFSWALLAVFIANAESDLVNLEADNGEELINSNIYLVPSPSYCNAAHLMDFHMNKNCELSNDWESCCIFIVIWCKFYWRACNVASFCSFSTTKWCGGWTSVVLLLKPFWVRMFWGNNHNGVASTKVKQPISSEVFSLSFGLRHIIHNFFKNIFLWVYGLSDLLHHSYIWNELPLFTPQLLLWMCQYLGAQSNFGWIYYWHVTLLDCFPVWVHPGSHGILDTDKSNIIETGLTESKALDVI